MSGAPARAFGGGLERVPHVRQGGAARVALIGTAIAFVTLTLLLPLGAVLSEALRDGVGAFAAALVEPDTIAAFELTLCAASVAVLVNLVFGLAAAWLVARFRFPGRTWLVTLIDLPFAVSPVIGGMQFVLLFGAQGVLGPWLEAHDLRIVFAPPGIILATSFVTFPFVARELIPFLESQGADEERSALVLGASGWQTFRRITIPNARWAILHGVVLCAARAMSEFGAVSVVSGHVQGATNTLPLQVEALYGEYRFSAAFSVSSLLVLMSLAMVVAKRAVEGRAEQRAAGRGGARSPERSR